MFEGFNLERWTSAMPSCGRATAARPAGAVAHGDPRTHVTWHKAARLLAGQSPSCARTCAATASRRSLWVPTMSSPHATCEYSWIRPPSRSRRRTRMFLPAAATWDLPSTVNLNVDLNIMLAVLAQALLAALRTRLPGYHAATPDIIQRRFLETPARSSPPATPSPSASNAAPTHPSCAKPACHPQPTSPGGTTGPCATSSPDLAPNRYGSLGKGSAKLPKLTRTQIPAHRRAAPTSAPPS